MRREALVKVGTLVRFLRAKLAGVRGGRGWTKKNFGGEMVAEWDPRGWWCGQVRWARTGVQIAPFFVKTQAVVVADEEIQSPMVGGVSIFNEGVLECEGPAVICLRATWGISDVAVDEALVASYRTVLTGLEFVVGADVPDIQYAKMEVTTAGPEGVPPPAIGLVQSVGIDFIPWAVVSEGNRIRHDVLLFDSVDYGMGGGFLAIAPPIEIRYLEAPI